MNRTRIIFVCPHTFCGTNYFKINNLATVIRFVNSQTINTVVATKLTLCMLFISINSSQFPTIIYWTRFLQMDRFPFSSTPVLTYSIDVVFMLFTGYIKTNAWITSIEIIKLNYEIISPYTQIHLYKDKEVTPKPLEGFRLRERGRPLYWDNTFS